MRPSLQGSVPALALTPLVKGHMDTEVKATSFTSHWRKRLRSERDTLVVGKRPTNPHDKRKPAMYLVSTVTPGK